MKTIPIINVSSVASSSATTGKASGALPSDQSFGHALSREVNGRSNANNDATKNAKSNVNSTPTDSSTSPSTTTGKTKSDDKAKPAADASAANTNTTNNANTDTGNGSAQILALVANVQQTDPNNGSIPASTPNATDTLSVGTLVGGVAVSAQSALNSAQTAAANGSAPANPDSTFAAVAAGVGLPTPATGLKDTNPTDSTTQPTAADLSALRSKSAKAEQPVASLGANDVKAENAGQAALDISAGAEKDLQAGLSALNANAAKITQATPATVSTAVLQQVMPNAQILPGNPSDKLTPPVGSAGWDQALGQKVVWMVAGGQQSASLTLNPPDLGPMHVVLSVTNSHATVTFTAAQPEVRQALEAAMPKLREMMGDAGIQLGQSAVNSGFAQQQNTSGDQSAQNSSRFSNTIDTDQAPIAITRATVASAGVGLVDTFA